MKKIILYAIAFIFVIACTTKKVNTETRTSTSTDLPFTLTETYKDWQIGEKNNAIIAMQMLKDWGNKNFKESVSYFADSCDFKLESYHQKLAHDSILPLMESTYIGYKSAKIEMQDWKSVVSADKKEEWVMLWCKEIMVADNGTIDSTNVINELRLENGKIIAFKDYIHHFPSTKN